MLYDGIYELGKSKKRFDVSSPWNLSVFNEFFVVVGPNRETCDSEKHSVVP